MKGEIFNKVPVQKVTRNLFDLSHNVKMSFKFGKLYPMLLMDTLPGDTVRLDSRALIRLAPMLAPVMQKLTVKTDFFFVPNRLVWNNWPRFITGGQEGTDPIVSMPYVTPATIVSSPGGSADFMRKGTLWDYFGLPIAPAVAPAAWSTERVCDLPFRAYKKIFYDWFVDPNVGNIPVEQFSSQVFEGWSIDGDSSAEFVGGTYGWGELRLRGWEKDYFTSALPWAQRGDSVLLPLSTSDVTINYRATPLITRSGGGAVALGDFKTSVSAAIVNLQDSANNLVSLDNIDSMEVNNATTTINDFRTALAMQKWMENNARGGGRYDEQILTHFNVRTADYRLQRSEYLGGGREVINISEVLATADSTGVPVGDMAGHGVSYGKNARFTYRCEEHGHIIGIISVVPDTSYDQGIERMWSRSNRYDFGWPEFANLGEQAIINKEVFFSFAAADDDDNADTFGYIPRYAEYKFKNSRISGDFRDTLQFWHLSRSFNMRPALNDTFVTMIENYTTAEDSYRRIFAVQDGTDYIWANIFHRLTAKRPLPYFGVPQLNG